MKFFENQCIWRTTCGCVKPNATFKKTCEETGPKSPLPFFRVFISVLAGLSVTMQILRSVYNMVTGHLCDDVRNFHNEQGTMNAHFGLPIVTLVSRVIDRIPGFMKHGSFETLKVNKMQAGNNGNKGD